MIFTLIAMVAVILGTQFAVLGVLRMYRFPDIYSRLYAMGKVATFGVTILLIAPVVLGVASVAKAFALLLFLLLAGPMLSHAISIAA
jgi:monovalent cation/proton antiporter MnhG/PhaG subunit